MNPFALVLIVVCILKKILHKIDSSQSMDNNLSIRYEQLKRRCAALNWVEKTEDYIPTEAELIILERRIEEQEELFSRYKKLRLRAQTMGWNITDVHVPMEKETLLSMEKEFLFSVQWYPLLIKSYGKLPFFLRRPLPSYPYKEQDIVSTLLFIQKKYQYWNRLLTHIQYVTGICTIGITLLFILL